MKVRVLLVLPSILAVLMMTSSAGARPLAAAISSSFTYQGRLTESGVGADGVYDFTFGLYDDAVAGSPVGPLLTKDDVAVSAGVFTVQLDFGDVFDGTDRWLEIGVRPGASGGAYTALIPRQPLTATPYALYSAQAPWSGLTGVPAGFADGVDNGASYQNVVVVAKSGGDFTTITAALNSISASDSNRYLIYVAPGEYTEHVWMEPYVDIQGSGELTTKITSGGEPATQTGTLYGADNAELRFLTIENTGGDSQAGGIVNQTSSPRLTHVTAIASGGTEANRAISNFGSSPTMTDVTASASGGSSIDGIYTSNYGVYNSSSSPKMTNVTASASGGDSSYGVANELAMPTMTNVTASASGATTNYGVYNHQSAPTMTYVTASTYYGTTSYGVFNSYESYPSMTYVTASTFYGTTTYGVYNDLSSPTMTHVIASASGDDTAYGVYNYESPLTMTDVTASASGGTTGNYGIYNVGNLAGDYTVKVNNSQITGGTSTIYNGEGFTTFIGASLLDGGAITGLGVVTCAGVYNESYVFYIDASTCP
jgi:hypothetical protein